MKVYRKFLYLILIVAVITSLTGYSALSSRAETAQKDTYQNG